MPSQSLTRGIFLAIIATLFGLTSMRYRIGDLSRVGPGMFPMIVSGILFALALMTIIQSRMAASSLLQFDARNIALVTSALVGFALISKHLGTVAAIIFMVSVASFAGTDVSWKRNAQIAIGLIMIAYAFQRFLGLSLRLV